MAGEWRKFPLEECMAAIIDYRGKTPAKTIFGIPLITAKIIKNGRIERPEEFIDPEDYEEWMRRGIPQAGDVVLTTEAPLGEVAQLDGNKVALAQRVIALRGKEGVLNNNFLKFLLKSKGVQEQLQGRASGSTVQGIRQSELRKVLLTVPSIKEQSTIAHILGTLDDKIELNRKMNETLEAMAQALFKDWFVDFGPVRAKMAGRAPYLSREIWDLFPNRLVESELGAIPEGWGIKGLDEIACFLNGLALQKFPPTEDKWLPIIKIAQLRTGTTAGADRASADIKNNYIVEDGDILFSWSGSLECVLWAGGKGALNQHLFKVTSEKFPRWLCYLGIYTHLAEFRHIAESKATTMGHIQRDHLSTARLTIPKVDVMEGFNKWLEPMIENLWKRNVESRVLAQLRDTLLPKLISGELRVKQAEKILERTV